MDQIWFATKYLIGSTSKEIPYEIVYSLKTALDDWEINQRFLITTALIDDPNYFFQALDPSKVIRQFLPKVKIDGLIQIASPRLYRHKPLNIVALYHELGHFVDDFHKVTSNSILLHPPATTDQVALQQEIYHRKEFFADLFAASYSGDAIKFFLQKFAPNAPESLTHPSTTNRIANIDTFLKSRNNKSISIIKDTLNTKKLPLLRRRFTSPDITTSFNNIRPYQIQNDRELHGILEAGWKLLQDIEKAPFPPWSKLDNEFEAERIINDLVEKSIRNKMLKQKWAYGTTH